MSQSVTITYSVEAVKRGAITDTRIARGDFPDMTAAEEWVHKTIPSGYKVTITEHCITNRPVMIWRTL